MISGDEVFKFLNKFCWDIFYLGLTIGLVTAALAGLLAWGLS